MKLRLRSTLLLILAAIGMAAVALWLALAGDPQPGAGSQLRVLFTGETLGRILPAVCEGQLAGGLEYRATWLSRQRRPFLLVDTGCLAAAYGDDAALWAEEVARALAAMDYDAINLGGSDVRLGAAEVDRLAAAAPMLLSANVRRSDDDQLALPSHRLSRRGRYSAAMTGIVDDALPAGPGLYIEPPREALARLLPALREQAPILIVLADLRPDQADALAAEFPEITLLLHRSRNDTRLPEKVNRSLVGAIYGDRYLADTTIHWQGSRRLSAATQVVELTTAEVGGDATAALEALPGIHTEPAALDFGRLREGERVTVGLRVVNQTDAAVRLVRVLSTCGCFAVRPRLPDTGPEAGDACDCLTTGRQGQLIPAQGGLDLDLELHAVNLDPSGRLDLHLHLVGEQEGLLAVPGRVQLVTGEEER